MLKSILFVAISEKDFGWNGEAIISKLSSQFPPLASRGSTRFQGLRWAMCQQPAQRPHRPHRVRRPADRRASRGPRTARAIG